MGANPKNKARTPRVTAGEVETWASRFEVAIRRNREAREILDDWIHMYALGVPEKAIQDILRHANVSTTNTYYIKTAPQQITDAMAKLERALPDSLTVN